LFDVKLINKGEDKILFINKNISKMKYISVLYDLRNMLFVDKFYRVDILDNNGRVIKKDLKIVQLILGVNIIVKVLLVLQQKLS